MHLRTSNRLLSPITHAGHGVGSMVRERPRLTIGGIVTIGALIAFGIWIWPEMRRTIRMHRM